MIVSLYVHSEPVMGGTEPAVTVVAFPDEASYEFYERRSYGRLVFLWRDMTEDRAIELFGAELTIGISEPRARRGVFRRPEYKLFYDRLAFAIHRAFTAEEIHAHETWLRNYGDQRNVERLAFELRIRLENQKQYLVWLDQLGRLPTQDERNAYRTVVNG